MLTYVPHRSADGQRTLLRAIEGGDHAGTQCATSLAPVRTVIGRLLVADEHEIVAVGLEFAFGSRSWHVESVAGASLAGSCARARLFRPDCALLSIHLGATGPVWQLIEPISTLGAPVVILTAERRRSVLAEYVEAGASCWVNKSATVDDIDLTLRRCLAGHSMLGRVERAALTEELRHQRLLTARSLELLERLSHREAVVLGALVDGLSAEEIAESGYVALSTVRSQIRSIFQKLGVRSQIAAVGLVSPHRHLLPSRGVTQHLRRRLCSADGFVADSWGGARPEMRSI